MSHFNVAVITACPTEVDLALQPFHEFECTGIKDKYVVPVDQTASLMKEYNDDEITVVLDSKGKIQGTVHDSKFEKNWTRSSLYSCSSNDKFVPPVDMSVAEVPTSKVWNFEEYLKKYHGYSLDGEHSQLTEDGKFFHYTNPNKKWDWWTIGGRWNNKLISKTEGAVNQCRLSELDWDAELKRLEERENDIFSYVEKCLNGMPFQAWATWDEIRDTNDSIEVKREKYNSQPIVKAIIEADRKDKNRFGAFSLDLDDYVHGLDKAVENAKLKAFSAYNLLVSDEYSQENKGWYGGEMGWFGYGTEEDNWQENYLKKLKSLPQDLFITIVDCHI